MFIIWLEKEKQVLIEKKEKKKVKKSKYEQHEFCKLKHALLSIEEGLINMEWICVNFNLMDNVGEVLKLFQT